MYILFILHTTARLGPRPNSSFHTASSSISLKFVPVFTGKGDHLILPVNFFASTHCVWGWLKIPIIQFKIRSIAYLRCKRQKAQVNAMYIHVMCSWFPLVLQKLFVCMKMNGKLSDNRVGRNKCQNYSSRAFFTTKLLQT